MDEMNLELIVTSLVDKVESTVVRVESDVDESIVVGSTLVVTDEVDCSSVETNDVCFRVDDSVDSDRAAVVDDSVNSDREAVVDDPVDSDRLKVDVNVNESVLDAESVVDRNVASWLVDCD